MRNSNAMPAKIKIGGRINRKCRKPSYIEGLRKSTYKTKITNHSKMRVREIILFFVVATSREDLSDLQLSVESTPWMFVLRLLYSLNNFKYPTNKPTTNRGQTDSVRVVASI